MKNLQCQCPFCGQQLFLPSTFDMKQSITCPTCFESFTLAQESSPNQEGKPDPDTLCPFCKEPLPPDAQRCEMCGEKLPAPEPPAPVQSPAPSSTAQSDEDSLKSLFICAGILILTLLVPIIIIVSINQENKPSDITHAPFLRFNAEYKKNLESFSESGHKLVSSWEIGLSKYEFARQLAEVSARWKKVCEDLPENHKGRKTIAKAIEAWVCAFKIWNEKHEKKGKNIKDYDAYWLHHYFLEKDIYSDTLNWEEKSGETVLQDVAAAAAKFYMDGYRELTE